MKAFRVVYQHGHFIDKESNNRVIPVQGEEYVITGNQSAFSSEDAKLNMETPLTAAEKSTWAETEFGIGNYYKILHASSQLFFRVGNSKRVKGDESNQYIFVCKLLEDLYLYLQKGKNGNSEKDWRLANCQCVLESCLLGGLTLTDKIPATSLNKLFSHTVMFYFSMQRSGSANAFDTFFKYTPNMKVYIEAITPKHYESLGKERKLFVKSRPKK